MIFFFLTKEEITFSQLIENVKIVFFQLFYHHWCVSFDTFTEIIAFSFNEGCKIPIRCWKIKLHIKHQVRVTALQVRGLLKCLNLLNEDMLYIVQVRIY